MVLWVDAIAKNEMGDRNEVFLRKSKGDRTIASTAMVQTTLWKLQVPKLVSFGKRDLLGSINRRDFSVAWGDHFYVERAVCSRGATYPLHPTGIVFSSFYLLL
ncbi:MAG TPA: hypothetical protein V6D19_15270 [Stenomitos sp.]